MIGASLSDFWTYWPTLWSGLIVTVELFLVSLPLAFLAALPVAAARNSALPALTLPAHLFIAFFRGAPMLPLLFLIYYGLPKIDWIRHGPLWSLIADPFPVAIIVIALNSSAFQAEILAGAARALPVAEIEAARVAGFRGLTLLQHVVGPQVMRRSARAYGNEMIFVMKATAAAGFITLQDLMSAANEVYLRSFDPLVPFAVAGAFYLALVSMVNLFTAWIENV